MQTISLFLADLKHVFSLTSLSFLVAIFLTPLMTNILYKYKLGKRIRKTGALGDKAPIFEKFHAGKENTPTMGGILVWGTTTLVILVTSLYAWMTGRPGLDLLAKPSIKLLLFTLIATGILGAIDDLLNIFGIGPHRGGFAFWVKFPLYLAVSSVGAFWFAYKLDWLHRAVQIPGFTSSLHLGYWYIPVFMLILVFFAFAADISDGLDGLSGGLLLISYLAYAVIALVQGNIPLAVFCGLIIGSLLAFLWFNIYPARFFMGDTGSMSLGMTLAVIAFLTNTVVALPIIAAVIVIDGLTSPLQILSKKFFKKKIFQSAPVHHHFQAIGWPEPKIVMRFWILSAVFALIGVVVALFSR